jgi:hypothetical protein
MPKIYEESHMVMRGVKSIFLFLVGLIVLSGCEPADDSGLLKLTIGSETIYSSNSYRETKRVEPDTLFIATVKVSKGGEIELSGADYSLFELKDNKLSFKTKMDPWNPSDENHDGGYDLDIIASNGSDTITYQVSYKITIPPSAKDLLSGHKFYIDFGKNYFWKCSFSDSKISVEKFIDYQSDENITVGIQYNKDTFSYTIDGNKTTCTLKSENPLTFSCKDPSGTNEFVFLERKPDFVIPASWKVSASDDNIHNDENTNAPHIDSFVVTGNAPRDNDGKAQIYKSKMDGNFTLSGTISSSGYQPSVLVMLENGSHFIQRTFGGYADNEQIFNCQFKGDDTTLNYSCENIDINDTDADSDTYIYFYACNDANLSDPDTKCNVAWVPALFIND